MLFKGDIKSIQSKSDAKSVQSKSDAKSIQSKSDTKSITKQETAPSQPSLTIINAMTGTTFKGFNPDTRLKAVLKQFLAKEGKQDSQDWALVRSLDFFNPLPLDKTLRECGIKDMEALICSTIDVASHVGRHTSEEVHSDTITVGMDCDGLEFYNASKDETIKGVMRHFLGLREKREVTKDDLKQYFLVTRNAPTQPLPKKKTLEECGIANNTILERSVFWRDSA